MKKELLLLFDADQELPHLNARWVPFDDGKVPPSPVSFGTHISRVRGGRYDRCACGRFHSVTFDEKGALVRTWSQDGESSRGPPP